MSENENLSPSVTFAQALRQFEWMISTPALLNCEHVPAEVKPIVIEDGPEVLTLAREKIAHSIEQLSGNRIGKIFEELFVIYLHCSGSNRTQRFKNIIKSLQVHDGKRTVGEYDVLFYDCLNQAPIHTEIAVKFYLADATQPNQLARMSNWLGPNRKDRLDLKYSKLFDQQLRLHQSTPGKLALSEHNIDTKQLQSRYFISGILFAPWQLTRSTRIARNHLPKECNESCAMGLWLPVSQLTQAFTDLGVRSFRILQRKQWIEPCRPSESNPFQPANLEKINELVARLLEEHNRYGQPVQLCCATENGYERLFVAPDDWSETT